MKRSDCILVYGSTTKGDVVKRFDCILMHTYVYAMYLCTVCLYTTCAVYIDGLVARCMWYAYRCMGYRGCVLHCIRAALHTDQLPEVGSDVCDWGYDCSDCLWN